jgi:hypothetical protein
MLDSQRAALLCVGIHAAECLPSVVIAVGAAQLVASFVLCPAPAGITRTTPGPWAECMFGGYPAWSTQEHVGRHVVLAATMLALNPTGTDLQRRLQKRERRSPVCSARPH